MFNWLNNLQWNLGFVEAGNTVTESLMDFYNLMCVYLVLISFLMGYWMFFMLKNHTFKKKELMNKFSWQFILKEKKI